MATTRLALDPAPSLLRVHHRHPERWPFLLASSAAAGKLGRWSLLLRADEDQPPLVLGSDASLRGPGRGKTFLDRLGSWAGEHAVSPGEGDIPFAGGWFVYLAYELAASIEPRLDLPAADDGMPVALARRCSRALLHDHCDGTTWLVAEEGADIDAALAEVTDAGGDGTDVAAAPLPPDFAIAADDGERFTRGVERIRSYIRAGDVFQVNLSRGWHGRSSRVLDAVGLYQALSASNPAPFAGMARLPGGTLISSSPERLVEVRRGQVQTRPIAGTRPRGRSAGDDAALSRELIAHPKERAEHIMLIDLERNDLGRVCVTGSVSVDELMVIESYAHVHHIVSNVRGRLRDNLHAADAIAAVFPGGTITGCPKVRCMEIIAELESTGRGFYTGAMGYLGRDGSLDLNILIRSMRVSGRELSFRTGAGIVADSRPRAELAETEAKARGLLSALGHD